MTSPHELLDAALERRRLALGMKTWRDLATAAGFSYETLRAIRKGEQAITPATAHGLETALLWKEGSIQAVMAGREPSLEEARTEVDLDAELAENERLIDQLNDRLSRRLSPRRDRELKAVMELLRSMAQETSEHGT